MHLDYTLPQPQRLEQISTLDLSTYTPTQLDYLTTYLLHESRSNNSKPTEPLSDSTPPTPSPTTHYTAPRPPIPWNCPHLIPLRDARAQLSIWIDKYSAPDAPPPLGKWHSNSQYVAFLKKWRKELSQDSGPILDAYFPRIGSHPTWNSPMQIDIDELVDYTNSFHIKQIILHYKQLRRAHPDTQLSMEYVDAIVENAKRNHKLSGWQLYLLEQRMDGQNQISIAIELAQRHNKVLSPSAMSTTMRTIYKILSSSAAQMEAEWRDQRDPSKWKICTTCGQTKHKSKYHWYEKRKNCRLCEKEKHTPPTNGTHQ